MKQASWRSGPAFLLATLTLVNTINWADRQVVPILVPSIKANLGLTDTELGLVGGVAFSLIYAVAAFVFGYLADRASRRLVILAGLLGWSLATAASGLATGFGSLFAARFFTGLGEASLYPCAMSLIADAFPAEKRGRAVGLIGASTAMGGGLGIGVGGSLVGAMGWREVFYLYGAAGILVLPMLLVLVEPARTSGEAGVDHDPPGRIVVEALRDGRLMAVWTSGTLLMAGATGWITWAPTYFSRDLGFDVKEIALIFGAAQLLGGVAGSLAGGMLGDLARRRRFAGQLAVSSLGALVTAPVLGLALLDVPHAVITFVALVGPFTFFAAFPNLQTMVAEIVPARRLGLTFAVHMLFLAGIGTALGPFLVGWISDLTGSLRIALLAPLACCVLAAITGWTAMATVRAKTPAPNS